MAGEPIEGVDVKLGKKSSGGCNAVVKTGEGGTFRFTDLPSGMYELTVPASLPNRSDVGGEGTISGNVLRGGDGEGGGKRIFRLSNVRANSTDVKAGIPIKPLLAASPLTAPPPLQRMKTSEHSGRPGLRAHRLGSTTTPAASASASSPMRIGIFNFTAAPGRYKLTIAGLPPQSSPSAPTVIAGGNVRRGSDGGMILFDRRGNTVAAAKAGDVQQGINSKENNKEPIGNFGVAWGLVRAWVLVPAWNLVPAWVLVATMGGAMGLVVPWVAPA